MPDVAIHYQYLASGIFANRLHKSNITFASELNKNYNMNTEEFISQTQQPTTFG